MKSCVWTEIENAIYDALAYRTDEPAHKSPRWLAFKALQNIQALEEQGKIKIISKKHKPSYYISINRKSK